MGGTEKNGIWNFDRFFVWRLAKSMTIDIVGGEESCALGMMAVGLLWCSIGSLHQQSLVLLDGRSSNRDCWIQMERANGGMMWLNHLNVVFLALILDSYFFLYFILWDVLKGEWLVSGGICSLVLKRRRQFIQICPLPALEAVSRKGWTSEKPSYFSNMGVALAMDMTVLRLCH